MVGTRAWFGIQLLAFAASACGADAWPPPICAEVRDLANTRKLWPAFAEALSHPNQQLLDRYPQDELDGSARYLGAFSYPGARSKAHLLWSNQGVEAFDDSAEPVPLQRLESGLQSTAEDWTSPLGILRREGRDYLVSGEPGALHHVVRFDAGPKETLVCRFAQHRPAYRDVMSGGHPACNAVLEGRGEYVAYDAPHALTMESFGDSRPFDILPGAAVLDFDGDGKLDALAQFAVYSSSAHCGGAVPILLDADRKRPVDGPMRDLLRGLPGECDSETRPFLFEKRAYLETRIRDDQKDIQFVHTLEGGKLRELCRIDTREENYVVPPGTSSAIE